MVRYGHISGRRREIVVDLALTQMYLTHDAHWLWDNLNSSIIPRGDWDRHDPISWVTQKFIEDKKLPTKWRQLLTGRVPW